MNPGFQEGRRPRANAVASLAHTGHASPLGRRPGVGFAAHGQQPGPAARPGPRPLSARQVAAVNAQNARIKREIEQVAAECKREIQRSNSLLQQRAASVAFNKIDFDQRSTGRDAATEVVQLPGTYRQLDVTRYVAGGLWIYATTLHDGWGDHQYFVYNPDTGALLHFVPEAGITDPTRRTYASKRARIQGIAAHTGMVGGYLEKGFLGTSALFLTGGIAAELGAYAFVTEEVAPVVSRIAVQAYRVAWPAVEAYAKKAAKGALMRMGVDAGFQFGTGYLAADAAQGNKGLQAWNGMNGVSVVAAGAIDTGGLKNKAKFLVALGSAVGTNLFTVSGGNAVNYGSVGHIVDFSNRDQTVEFVRNVVLSTLFDQSKEHGSEWIAKRLAARAEAMASQASGKASQAVLRFVTEARVALPASIVIGGSMEVPKKKWENNKAAEDAKKKKASVIPHPPVKGR